MFRWISAAYVGLAWLAVSAGPAFAQAGPTDSWAQLLAVRAHCRAPAQVERLDPGLETQGDALVLRDPDFDLRWSTAPDVTPAIREFLADRSRAQMSAIAACLREERAAGRWPAAPHAHYVRKVTWDHADGASGLQAWYQRDFDDAGALGAFGSAVVWDLTEGAGRPFQDLLLAGRTDHFAKVLCLALRTHPQAAAQGEPCPRLDQVSVMVTSTGCREYGFKIERLTAWYEWKGGSLALDAAYDAFIDDLKPEYRRFFGVSGCRVVE